MRLLLAAVPDTRSTATAALPASQLVISNVLWTDLSGAHLIAYCGTPGVLNGTRFMG
jgi:hypothetical protein